MHSSETRTVFFLILWEQSYFSFLEALFLGENLNCINWLRFFFAHIQENLFDFLCGSLLMLQAELLKATSKEVGI